MFVSKTIYNKPCTTNQKPKKIKRKNKGIKYMRLKKLKNENKQREKYLLKNKSFLFLTPNHPQFLQKGMQGGNTRFFNK